MKKQNQEPYAIQLAEISARLFNNCSEKEIQHVAKFGVSLAEFRCLKILFERGEVTVKELAQNMELTSSRITRIVDGLVDKNYVLRISGKNDRRTFHLSLTSKGNTISKKLIQHHQMIHEDIVKFIPEKDRKQLIQSLEVLNHAVEKWLDSNIKNHSEKIKTAH